MAEYDGLTPGQVLADASVAEFVKSLGLSIAEAQKALDENSVDQIAEFIIPREGLGGKTLLDLGLSPAFYHYQHADLSCSLQLSLKVEKNFGVGLNLNGSFNDTDTGSGSSTSSETSTESGNSNRTESREANIEITAASAGSLNIGGQAFPLTGNTPAERIGNLRRAITTDTNNGIAGALYQLQPTPLVITSDAPANKVHTDENTIAFLSGGFDSGIIRIGTDTDTPYTLNDSPSVNIATTAQGSLESYATHVDTLVQAEGYRTNLVAPTDPIYTVLFDTGDTTFRAADEITYRNGLLNLSKAMIQLGFSVKIEGFADRQRYPFNVQLGMDRAKLLRDALIANGVPASQIQDPLISRGEQAATDNGDNSGQDNQRFRKAEIRTLNRTEIWLFVHSQSSGSNLNAVAPDMIGDGSSSNGFIFLFKPTPLDINDKKVTIDGTDFPLSSATVSGGSSPGSARNYALNLTNDINGNASADLSASSSGNIVTVSKKGDKFQLTLYTTEQRQINLTGSEGITVTQQFSRTRSTSQTRENTGNRAVAVGASLDVNFSRKFEMNVSGNSSITARLVSIPAPPQFLETIQQFLSQDG